MVRHPVTRCPRGRRRRTVRRPAKTTTCCARAAAGRPAPQDVGGELQHGNSTAVNGGRSADSQVRGRSRNLATRPQGRRPEPRWPEPHTTSSETACAAATSTGAPYGAPACGSEGEQACELRVDFPRSSTALLPRPGTRPVAPSCGVRRLISASISTFTVLPTSTPPVSSAWFQVRPKASRSISVLAEKPTACGAPRGGGDALERRVEHDRAGDAADREVALEPEPVAVVVGHPGAAEGDRRELLDVEEVGAAQVVVALGVAGGDAGRRRW